METSVAAFEQAVQPLPLIAVDEDDTALGPVEKADCHRGDGVLHRAFSVFLFDAAGRVLLQRRSPYKPLWPGWWANSCCSHPRWGERLEHAVPRRVREELGMRLSTPPRWRFRFIYHAHYGHHGSERELCHVFTARVDGRPAPDPTEVGAWCWMQPAALEQALRDQTTPYTPWLRLEWPQLAPLLTSADD